MSTTFEYVARQNGKRVKGTQRAPSREDAFDILTRRGLAVSKCMARTAAPFSVKRIIRNLFANDLPDRIRFFRGYAALESQGVAFNEAFDLLIKHTPKGPFNDAIAAVRDGVRQGSTISVAMADRPDEFTPIEVALIAAGEESRGRAEILDRLATFLERDSKLRKRLSGALTYPGIVVVAAIMLLFYSVMWLLPVFSTLYQNFNVPIPGMMQVALDLGNALRNPLTWLGLAGAGIGIGYLVNRYVSTERGAYQVDKVFLSDWKLFNLKLWPFGVIRRKSIISRVSRALAALLASGVEIEKAFDTIIPIAESPVYAKAFEKARDSLKSGAATSIAEALKIHEALDEYSIGFVEIGERVAEVPEMLKRLAEYYDDEIESLLQTLPEKIQVLVMIFLGFVVGYLAYIVYVPMATLSTSIH